MPRARRSAGLRVGLATLLALALGAGVGACGDTGTRTAPAPSPEGATPSSGGPEAGAAATRRPRGSVLLVSIDGLNPDALTRLGRRGAPHLNRLLATGTGTRTRRTSASSSTIPART